MIKKILRWYPLALLRGLLSIDAFCDLFHIRRRPTTIQMPITSRCNSRCSTCNVWKLKEHVDINPGRLREVLNHPFFEKVESIGINGGELSIVPSFDDIFDAILTAPSLKNLYLISNGLLPQKLLPLLEACKVKCDKKGIKMNIAISVDGVGRVHEDVRGVPNCFQRTEALLNELKNNQNKYAHSVSIGCTLSQRNIAYVHEIEEFLSHYPFYVQYHIAVPNKRINTFDCASEYYMLDDERSKMLATEYFYGKFLQAERYERFAYFAQYQFLLSNGHKRLTRCSYKFKDVTIDEHLKMYLCATASDEIGDFSSEDINSVVRKQRIRETEKKVCGYCDQCVHYMYDQPTWYGLYSYCKEAFKSRFDWGLKFKLLAK